MTEFALPKFTFILSTPNDDSSHKLAIAIAGADRAVNSMREPLIDMYLGLIGRWSDNITENGWEQKPCLLKSSVSNKDFLNEIETFLRSSLGVPGALGKLCLDAIQKDGDELIYDGFIYHDVSDPEDIHVFANSFGPSSCLVINIGPLHRMKNYPGHQIWLAVTEHKARLEQLLIDLGERK